MTFLRENLYEHNVVQLPLSALHEDMEAVPLKPYLTRSSYDHQYNLKQNAVKELHRKVNILLGIAQNLTK